MEISVKEKKSSLRFSGKAHSKKGILSAFIAGVSWIVFLVLCVYSTIQEGQAELVVGAVGMLDAGLALLGAFLAMKGLQEREVYYIFPTVGILLNGVLFVIYFSLYFMGVAIV